MSEIRAGTSLGTDCAVRLQYSVKLSGVDTGEPLALSSSRATLNIESDLSCGD